MPRPKGNFAKLKTTLVSDGRSANVSYSAKKQATLSRFFSNSPQTRTREESGSNGSKQKLENEQSEELDVFSSEKQTKPVKSIVVPCFFSKRPASSSPERGNLQDGSKKVKLNSGEATPSTTVESSLKLKSPQDRLSKGTRNRLSHFQATPSRTIASSCSSLAMEHTQEGDKKVIFTSQNVGFVKSSPQSQQQNKMITDKSSRSTENIKYVFNKSKAKSTTSIKDESDASMRSVSKPSRLEYTPLEQQFVEIKEQYSDAVLFVECGYKYKFFGEDAEIAAKELNIYSHLDHNFMVASIPVHRLFVHARRLVAKGYKVGVVKQMETAALKAAGKNKNTPFKRQLSALYTKSTLIGEDVDPVSGAVATDGEEEFTKSFSSPGSNYLLCLSEFVKKGAKTSKAANLQYGLVAVQPATGDIIYDCFHDNQQMSELDSRLHHIQPVELLIPIGIFAKTEKLLQDFAASSPRDDDRVRIERMSDEHFEHSSAFEEVAAFYRSPEESTTEGEKSSKEKSDKYQEIINLPVPVICCLAALLKYLKEFQLHRVLKEASNFVPFSAATQVMKLNACALKNLEIFKNQTDGSKKGSLFWVLDHTSTRFGARMLRKWLSQPLMDARQIESRQDAIGEILDHYCEALSKAKNLLAKAPDLERGICSIYHKKCSTTEFVTVVKYLHTVATSLVTRQAIAESELKSDLLKAVFTRVPSLLEGIEYYLNSVDEKAAKEGDKTKLFVDISTFPALQQCQRSIEGVLAELQEHQKEVRKVLRRPSLDYVTVSGAEFLIEVRNSKLREIPGSWTKISSTKQVSRFHSPFIVKAYKRLSQLREQLNIECQQAWLNFLELFGERYFAYRQAIQHLATLDCLFSLAKVASQEGYIKPELSEDTCIQIKNGCHPIVSALLTGEVQFVANSTHMGANGQRCMIITGPNMGGKSSYIKQVALICIMAQIGSYVPAESARLGILDAVYTRMGASDNIYQNCSTFMVELSEASDIISHATRRSLIILDELGRGTSTHDGVAIAFATAKHFISEVRCLLLFVSHYPPLTELEKLFPSLVGNYHMSFLLHETTDGLDDGIDVLTFLYQLVKGMAAKSYGLNVAKLADIPTQVIQMAAGKSHELEKAVMATRRRKMAFNKLWGAAVDEIIPIMDNFTKTSDSGR